MKNFILYDSTGKILAIGTCQDSDFELQAKAGQFVMEGIANDGIHKIVDGKVVNKTPEEIAADAPIILPPEKQQAWITNEQWEDIQNRITALELKMT